MTIIKWKTGWHHAQIERVEVERETDSTVWIGQGRHPKQSGRNCYHDTWKQAHAALMARANSEVVSARAQLARANDRMGNVKGMRPPKDEA